MKTTTIPRRFPPSRPPQCLCSSSSTFSAVPVFSCPNASQPETEASPLTTSANEWNTRLRELVKSNRLKDARHLFDTMLLRDVASWTIIISGYVSASNATEALLLFSRMCAVSVKPDPFVLSVTLKACGLSSPINERSRLGRPVHAYTVKCGLDCSVFVASALLDMYAKAGLLPSAIQIFDHMPQRNVVTWTAIITALARAGHTREAIRCFVDMRASRVAYDSHTFAIALKACADSCQLACGREIHTQAVRLGFDTVPFVANTLSALYSKCGKVEAGLILFKRMRAPDVVSWTTTISTLAQMGREEQAVQAFVQMLRHGEESARPNEYTFAAVISACGGLTRATWGKQLHALSIRAGVARSLSTSNATMTMYARSGQVKAANMVFQDMTFRDIVSWSAVISGHAQEGSVEEAFRLFSNMRSSGMEATEYALASLLTVCAQMTMLEQGRQVHAHVISAGLEDDSTVSSTLVNMYSKCGCVAEAHQIFGRQGWENVVSWTSMINGLADHGHSREAIELFERMQLVGLRPDSVTFIGLLSACSHAGLVDMGFKYFKLMQEKYAINPEKEHFGCIVDLLCRAGRLNEAEQMIESMPFRPDDVVWSILLQACRIHGNVECGRRATERILEVQPNCAGTLITLSNLYAAKGRWRDAANMRVLMRTRGMRKEPGWSWIIVGERSGVFVSGDRKHPRSEEIYSILYLLTPRAKTASGDSPGSESLQIDEEED